jgi:arsenate reductase (thioredoxin)
MNSESKSLNVLFLCSHNSGRSIMAEAMLNHLADGRFKAYSAGSYPQKDQTPNPMALETLKRAGVSIEGLHSKNWDQFGRHDASHMDLVITVCDDAAGDVCPIWPGHPATAHWGIHDPATVTGSDEVKMEAYRQALHLIARRLDLLMSLPIASLTKLTLEQHLLDIGSQ